MLRGRPSRHTGAALAAALLVGLGAHASELADNAFAAFKAGQYDLAARWYHDVILKGGDEGEVAALLSTLDERFPSVNIGSYPRWQRDGRYHLVVTFDSREADRVEEAVRALESALPDARRLGAEGLDAEGLDAEGLDAEGLEA